MDDQVLASIYARFESEDPSERLDAVRELTRFVNVAASEAEPNSNSRQASAEDLAAWDSAVGRLLNRPDISGALLASLEDSSAEVRSWAAIQAGRLEDPRAKEALIRHLLSDPSPHVRLMCAMLPPTQGGSEVVAALVQTLKDPFPRVVAAACTMLRRMGDRSTVPAFRELLAHETWQVRFEACQALVELGSTDTVVVTTIEGLQNSSEASEHDKLARRFNESESDPVLKVEHTPLVSELLERALG